MSEIEYIGDSMLASSGPIRSKVVLASGGRIMSAASSPSQAFLDLKTEVVGYLDKKSYLFPRDILTRDSFEVDDGSLAVESLATSLGQIWATRFSEPDTSTPGRTWTVEITLGCDTAGVSAGTRLSCFSRNDDFSFDPRAPRLLSDFVSKHRLYSTTGYAFSSSVLPMESEEDAASLITLINHPRRWANVIVFSADNYGRAVINPERCAFQLAGVAHVFSASPRVCDLLTANFGRDLGVFDKGVRVYRPNFSEDDERSRHPLVVRRHLESASSDQIRQFERWLREISFVTSIERNDLAREVPTFAAIRSAAATSRAQQLKEGGASIEDQLKAQEAARLAAEAAAESSLSLAVQEEELRQSAEQERDQYKGQIMSLAARVEALEAKLHALGEVQEVGERPTSYDDMPAWVEENFAGKLALAPRAVRALKGADYESIDVVCSAISLLAQEYRSVLLGRFPRDDFDKLAAERGFSLSGSIAESRAGEFGDEYYIRYGGQRRFMHGHLQKGNSHQSRYCLRIYFFWMSDEEQIVVGWLPSHLTNRLS